MREQSRLERSYRRLLWAYPRFYRRHRGVEIVTTMLEAAKPGQIRPSRAEVIHLLACGLRVRLVPSGWAGKIAAGIVTLWVAVVLGGAGAYAMWSSQDSSMPPLDDARIAEAADALAGQPASRVRLESSQPLEMAYNYKSLYDTQTFLMEGWAGARPEPASHRRVYEQVAPAQALAANAVHRLRQEGWQTGATTHPDSCACEVFWASRDGFLLRFYASGSNGLVLVHAYRAEPQGVPQAAVAGFLAGLLLTWPIMVWLVNRVVRTPRPDRTLIVLIGLPVLYACVANTVDNVLSMVPDPDSHGALLAADFMYPLANQSANPLAATVIALGLAASLGITAFTPWRRVYHRSLYRRNRLTAH